MKVNDDVLAALGEVPTKEEKKATRASKYGGDEVAAQPKPKTARVKKEPMADLVATDEAVAEKVFEDKPVKESKPRAPKTEATETKKPVTLAQLNKETERLEKAAKVAKEKAIAFARKEEMSALKSQIAEAERNISDAERAIENNAKLRDKLITKIDKLNAAWNAKEK